MAAELNDPSAKGTPGDRRRSRPSMKPAAFRAVRRVANYLRTLGLCDRGRVRELSHRIVLDVSAEDPEQHAARAVAEAQLRFEAWRDALRRALPAGVDPLWLRAFIGARPELFLGDVERAQRAALRFGDPLAGKGPRHASFRPQAFEPARLPEWLRGALPPLLLTVLAARALWLALAADGVRWLELSWVVLFAFLFGQAAVGLSTALSGLTRRQRAAALPALPPASEAPLPRTALVMPIYHEDAGDAFAALAGMREALARLPGGNAFEVFVLSDSLDPEIAADEERAFSKVAGATPSVPIYYRRRGHNEGHKAGNLAEFFERWGPRYEYVAILDADSILSGETLIELVRRLHADPRLALLQAPIAAHRGETLLARALAFSSSVCGPMFTRGLAAWSDKCGNYYGHNAVLRVRAFLDCCQLPQLHGEPPFGGQVLSHDFVEAALLCRAGWHVRIAHDLPCELPREGASGVRYAPGSYEELPPTLAEYVARDHRWCQGNLQHLRVVRMRGLAPMSRIHMLLGAFAYLAGPAWLAFLIAGALLWSDTGAPFQRVAEFVGVLTLAVLLGPWLLGFLDTARDALRRRAHGGGARLLASTLLGILTGALLAPVLMVHHTRIVASILWGRAIGWVPQQRRATSKLSTVLREELPASCLGAGALALALSGSADFVPWLAPIWVPWLLAIPIDLCVSSARLGRWLRRRALLLIPAESDPEPLLLEIQQLRARTRSNAVARFRDLVLDPVLLQTHLAQLSSAPAASPGHLAELRERALEHGPSSLTVSQWRLLTEDAESMHLLHREAWQRWPVESWDLGREEPRLPPEQLPPDTPVSARPSSSSPGVHGRSARKR